MSTSVGLVGKVEQLTINPLSRDEMGEVRQQLRFSLEGLIEDRYYGIGRKIGVKEKSSFRLTKPEIEAANIPGQEEQVLNWRQWSAVSLEEMMKLAKAYGLPETREVALHLAQIIGANITVSGIENFTDIPPASLLAFPRCRLLVVTRTLPCEAAGKKIAHHYDGIDASRFPEIALGIRGQVGMVFKGGEIDLGAEVTVLKRGQELRW